MVIVLSQEEDSRREFGQWLRQERESRRLTRAYVTKAADVSDMTLYRLETGEGGSKRETVRAIARAIGVDENTALLKAGYAPTEEYWSIDLPGPIQNDPNGFRYEPIDYAAAEAFLRGLPPQLQQEEYDRLKRIWMEHQRGQTDFGKKAEDE